MSNLNNVKSIILNHKKITNISNSPLILPTSESSTTQSSSTILTEKSLPLNHSIQESLKDKYFNPENNLITYESVENSVQQNSLQFDKILTEIDSESEKYDLNICYDSQFDFYNNSTNEKLMTIHQIINSAKTKNYLSTTSTTPGYSLIYTKDNRFKNSEANNNEEYITINPDNYETYRMTYQNYKTVFADNFPNHSTRMIYNQIIDDNNDNNEIDVLHYSITNNNNTIQLINIRIINFDNFNSNLVYVITPIKGHEHIETSINDYLSVNNQIKIIETRKTIYTKLNPYETISEDIYDKLLTTNALENAYITNSLLFANTLTNNENNTDEYIIHGRDDDNYDLTEDSYPNIHLLDGSADWFYGDKEIDSNTHVFEINEQYKKDDLNYQYRWYSDIGIVYPRKTYNDDNFGTLDANYIYIKFEFLNLKYSVDDDIWYRYKWSSSDGWIWDTVSLDSTGKAFFDIASGNIKALISMETTENNKIITMYIYQYEFDPSNITSDYITYDNTNLFRYFTLTINYSGNEISSITRDNNEIVIINNNDNNDKNYNLIHNEPKTFESSTKERKYIDDDISFKLLTTNALEDTYINDKLLFAKTLTTNSENIEYVVSDELTEDNYELTFDSYENMAIVNPSGNWFRNNEYSMDPKIYELTEIFKKGNLYYQYKWNDYSDIRYVRIDYDDYEADNIYINYQSKIKYNVSTDKFYKYSYGSWTEMVSDNGIVTDVRDGILYILVKVIQNNNKLVFDFYINDNDSGFNPLNISNAEIFTYNSTTYFRYFTLNIEYSDSNLSNVIKIVRDNYAVIKENIDADEYKFSLIHENYKMLDIDPKIEYKLITTDSLNNVYMKDTIEFNEEFKQDENNSYKLITTNSLKDAYVYSSINYESDKAKLVTVNALKEEILPKFTNMIMNNCYYCKILNELDKSLVRKEYKELIDIRYKVDGDDVLVYNSANDDFIGRIVGKASSINDLYVDSFTITDCINKYLVQENYYDFKFEVYECNVELTIEKYSDNTNDTFSYVSKYAIPVNSDGNYNRIISTIKRYKAFIPKYINVDDEFINIAYYYSYDSSNSTEQVNYIEFNSNKLIIGQNAYFGSNTEYSIKLSSGSMIENINSNGFNVSKNTYYDNRYKLTVE